MIIKRNENTAELVGLIFGDGGLTYRKNTSSLRFQLRGHLIEDKEHYDNHIIPLFNKEVMFPIFKRKVSIVLNKNKGFYGISVEGVKIVGYLDYLGIPRGIKKELYIPKWIKSNKKYTIKFLRGLFDTDGSINCEKNYSLKNPLYHTKIKLSISSTSKNLIKEISEILNNLKIKNFIKKPYKWKQRNWKDLNKIMIDGGVNVNRWFKFIGSKNHKHITRYLIWKNFNFCPPYTNLEERRKILKGKINPHSYYNVRECRSGQTNMAKDHMA